MMQDGIKMLLECSRYVAPNEPGLTHEEIIECAVRLGRQRGEVRDEINDLARQTYCDRTPDGRFVLSHDLAGPYFNFTWEGDPRSPAAAQFVIDFLDEVRKEYGRDQWSQKSSLVAAANDAGHDEHKVDVAISVMSDHRWVETNDSGIRLGIHGKAIATGSHQTVAGLAAEAHAIDRPRFRDALAAVRHVVEARTPGSGTLDGDPLSAIGEFVRAVHDPQVYRWWLHLVDEFEHSDAHRMPFTSAVLSGALVEGILAMLGQKIRETGLSMTSLEADPKKWTAKTLAKSASQGQNPVLDAPARSDADAVIELRNCVHGGRVLRADTRSAFNVSRVEAERAQASARRLARRVADWLHANDIAPSE